jgi:hypothetical protein
MTVATSRHGALVLIATCGHTPSMLLEGANSSTSSTAPMRPSNPVSSGLPQ